MQHLLGSAPRRAPFSDWLANVDRQLVRRVGIDSGSVDDWPWSAEYQCGISPREAVDNWIAENMAGRRSTIWL